MQKFVLAVRYEAEDPLVIEAETEEEAVAKARQLIEAGEVPPFESGYQYSIVVGGGAI